MTTEFGLRIAIGLVYLAIISVQVYYHRLASEKGNLEEMKRRPLQSIVVAVMGFLNMLLIAAYIVWGEKLSGWASLGIPGSLRWSGVVVGVCGLALFFWTHMVLGRNFSCTTRIQDEQELIMDGPYHYVQHPMYTAFLLFAISFFLITANWLIGICWLFGVFLLVFVRLRREEEGLRERFGEAYENYSQTTARLIPGVW
jgi:protein-S-isoprenylcysteine O-methyltransferase Ste14